MSAPDPKDSVRMLEDGVRQSGSVFLPKQTYRQRRILDAVKAWPLLGAFLFGLPVMWHVGTRGNVGAMIYLFGVWALLIVGAGALSWVAMRARAQGQDVLPPFQPPSEPRL